MQWAALPLAAVLLTGCVAYESRDAAGDGGAATGPRPSPGTREVSLKVVEQDERTLALVPVSLEGRGPYMFALDTGAASSVVDDDTAREIGLRRTGERREVTGVLGSGEVPVAEVERWQVGHAGLDPGEITIIDLGPPGEGGTGLDGLLGSDVLSEFGEITVDYEDGVLVVPEQG